MRENELKKYLSGDAEDYQSLSEHDKIYHRGGYKEGDACKVRDAIKKSDDPDSMVAKAKRYGEQTKTRKDAEGVIKDMFGGSVRFDETDGRRYDGSVHFQAKPGKDLVWGARIYENKLADLGYKADLTFDGFGRVRAVNGSIRKFTPTEMLERVRSQKPKYDPDGDYKVDGEYYDTKEEAMEGWKQSMKKYGSAAKKYLSMCEDEYPRRHADGSECKAKSPDSCPFNKKAESGEKGINGDERKSDSDKDSAPKDRDEFNKWIRSKDLEKDLYDNGLDASELFEGRVHKIVEDVRKNPWGSLDGDTYAEILDNLKDKVNIDLEEFANTEIDWGRRNSETGDYDHPKLKRAM